jgi:hypothetical protein
MASIIPSMASIEGLAESMLLNSTRNQKNCPCSEMMIEEQKLTPFRDLQESNQTIATDAPSLAPAPG